MGFNSKNLKFRKYNSKVNRYCLSTGVTYITTATISKMPDARSFQRKLGCMPLFGANTPLAPISSTCTGNQLVEYLI